MKPSMHGHAIVDVDGRTLTLEAIATIARYPGRCQLRLSRESAERIAASAALRARLVESGIAIYGVTTGFGNSADSQVSADMAAELQQDLIRYHLNGAGPSCPPEVVRAMILVRANCLARGVSGVRVKVVESLLRLLAEDILPVVPQLGSLGASGDLVPSSYLANVLLGDGEVLHHGKLMPAAEALHDGGIAPLVLEPKEGLALINGTSFMTAYAVLVLADAEEVAFAADLCTALTSQVLLGYRGHFASFLSQHKAHPGQIASSARVAALLAGSLLSTDPAALQPMGPASSRRLDRQVQDRYSVRCAPHVVGVLHDTLEWARRWVSVEVNSANDNPLFDVEAGVTHSGGNFYGGHIAQAMDSLKVAVASVADLLDRQLALIVDDKFSHGLPSNLTPSTGPGTRLFHGYKGMQIACSAFTAEALKLAAPATVFSRSTEAHNQDKVSMGAIAARDAYAVTGLTEHVTAVHLHALCQAADLRGHELLSPATRRARDLVRVQVPFLEADRRMDGEVSHLVGLVRQGLLRQACENTATAEVEHFDVIVIGGGPAGATAAAVLARRGRSVLVLERSTFPRFHIGESMLPYACALLHRLGFADAVAESGFPIKSGAEFTEVGGAHSRVDFTAQGTGRSVDTYQVERADFDDALLRVAVQTGATVRQGAKVTGMLTDGRGRRIVGVTYSQDGRDKQVLADLTLDASGRAGVITHQHLRAREINQRLRMVALYRHFNNVDEHSNPGVAGDIQIGSHDEGWVWAIPIRRDKLSIGIVTRPETLAGANRETIFDSHVGRIPRIAQRLRGAGKLGELRGESDFCYHTEALAGAGFFVLGDAGCFVDPIFSGGVFLSLITGSKAAELADDVLAARLGEAEAIETYARFYKTGYDCYFRLIYAFYESRFKLGPYLKSTGVQVSPRWLARLLSGDFWSHKNPLAQHLRGVERFATFKPFEPLFGCPVYPELEAGEPDDAALDASETTTMLAIVADKVWRPA